MATAMANNMASYGASPKLRGSWVSDKVKQAGNWIDEKIGKPITETVKGVKRATGFETTPIPDSVKPQVNQGAAAALSNYGNMVTRQAGQFNPADYGPNYFQPQTYNPASVYKSVNMPGAVGQVSAPGTPRTTAAPTTPTMTAAPTQATFSGDALNVQDYSGVSPDLSKAMSVYGQQIESLSTPYDLQAGYDSGLFDSSMRGFREMSQRQMEEDLARQKEEQMKAGNYGSSVGQEQRSDLIQDYRLAEQQKWLESKMNQMQAEREDRYRNIGVDQSRMGMAADLAGATAGLEMSGAGFARDTMQLQNDAERIKEQFAREGKQLDNNTAMMLAEFSSGQKQQDFSNRFAGAEFLSGQRQQDFANRMANADFRSGQNQIKTDNDWKRYLADQDEIARAEDKINQAQLYNLGQRDTANIRNYGLYQDALQGLANYGSNQIDPQSEMNYKIWLAQKQDQANKLNSSIGAVSTIVDLL